VKSGRQHIPSICRKYIAGYRSAGTDFGNDAAAEAVGEEDNVELARDAVALNNMMNLMEAFMKY